MSALVKIDGSLGEGGGQVLRTALSLSTLYNIPVEISNIRAGRPKPGLAVQHLKGVELVKEMCNAKVSGAYIGSTRLTYYPGPLNKHKRIFEVDTRTAGCICLLAQVALPCTLFFPFNEVVTLILKGGTNVPMGPHIEYLTEVFKPLLKKFGADFDFSVLQRGYYPKGGGEVHLYIKPIKNLNGIHLVDPGVPTAISGWAYVAGSIRIDEARKMISDVKNTVTTSFMENNTPLIPINIEAYREDRRVAVENGAGINIVCHTSSGCIFGGSGLSSRNQEEPTPGTVAATAILEPILTQACVDKYSQDQVILFMALAQGTSKIRVGTMKLTSHTETAIKIAEIMLREQEFSFHLSHTEDNAGVLSYFLECNGCGLVNKSYDKYALMC